MDYISLKIQNTSIYLYEKQTNPFPNWGYGILLLMIFTICERESYFLTRRTRGCIFFIFYCLTQPKNFPFKCRKLLVLSYRLFQENAFSEKESYLTKRRFFLEHPMVCSI